MYAFTWFLDSLTSVQAVTHAKTLGTQVEGKHFANDERHTPHIPFIHLIGVSAARAQRACRVLGLVKNAFVHDKIVGTLGSVRVVESNELRWIISPTPLFHRVRARVQEATRSCLPEIGLSASMEVREYPGITLLTIGSGSQFPRAWHVDCEYPCRWQATELAFVRLGPSSDTIAEVVDKVPF